MSSYSTLYCRIFRYTERDSGPKATRTRRRYAGALRHDDYVCVHYVHFSSFFPARLQVFLHVFVAVSLYCLNYGSLNVVCLRQKRQMPQ